MLSSQINRSNFNKNPNTQKISFQNPYLQNLHSSNKHINLHKKRKQNLQRKTYIEQESELDSEEYKLGYQYNSKNQKKLNSREGGSGNVDVDQELWRTLELCEDDELCAVYDILQADSWFSPLGKRILGENEPSALNFRGRKALMRRIEKQFRFLAADSMSMIRGVRPSYRQTLVNLTQYLKIDCPSDLATPDLESEIFLYVLDKCQGVLDQLKEQSPEKLASYVQPSLPKRAVENIGNAIDQVMAPLRLGSKEVSQTVAKIGGVVAVQKFSSAALQKLATHVLAKNGQYQIALRTLLTTIGRQSSTKSIQVAALKSAQKGVTQAAARYSATRGALSLLGPLMWIWMGVDLTLLSLGTDYARVIRAVCLLAQVRLLRTKGWLAPEWQ
eukprot:TRINITY_DN37783_c1_g3_i1.p1 TRINITY_DN37783_c1_g3~~TRINITY_DN37783_c1_g3_i1.p1  ORF type:complete len:387 (+),score=43.67 TRINITY_DN37783_c1_g3_i1:176-1336(+)